jgi:hypothetical protein
MISVALAVLAGCPAPAPNDTDGPATTGTTAGDPTGAGSTTGSGTSGDEPTGGDPTGGDPTGGDPTGPPPTGTSDGTTGEPGTSTSTGTSETGDPPPNGWTERDMARVFISGHSLTDNPLPEFVMLIADSLGDDFNYNQQIGLGSPIRVRTLGDSWDNLDWPGYKKGKNRDGVDMDVIAELKSPATLGPGELYDTLVITERHDILDVIRWEDTAGLLRHYHDRLIDGNAAGQTLFYHSWLDVDKNAPQQWIDHEKKALYAWECAASKVNHTLEAEGRADRLMTLPTGAALVHLVEKVLADEVAGIAGPVPQKLDQLFSDNVHLTQLGVYYVALVTYTAVFRGSPIGAAAPDGVDAQTAADMQQLAWDFVRGYYTTPDVGVHTMEECRDFISQQVCESFWTLLDDPGKISNCQTHFADENANNGSNPFKWPDPGLMPWPDP